MCVEAARRTTHSPRRSLQLARLEDVTGHAQQPLRRSPSFSYYWGVADERDDFMAPGRARLLGLQRGEQNAEHATTLRIITRAVNGALDRIDAPGERLPVPPRLAKGAALDEGWGTKLLETLMGRVERATRRMGVVPLPGVAIGAVLSPDLSPLSSHVHGSSAMVAVPVGTMVFANLLAKALVPLVCRVIGSENDMLELGLGESSGSHTKDALRRFAELMAALALHGNPGNAPRYMPSPGWRWWSTVGAFRDAIEFFCVAHEYGHLLHAHERFRLLAPDDADAETVAANMPLAEELVCDAFAIRAALKDKGEPLPLRLAGPIAMMRVFDLLQCDGHMPVGSGHPAASERLAIMRAQIDSLEGPGIRPRTFANLRRDIERMEAIIERAWIDVRGSLESIDLGENGVVDHRALMERLGAVVVDVLRWHIPPTSVATPKTRSKRESRTTHRKPTSKSKR